MAQLTEFGKKVKIALITEGKSVAWLQKEVTKNTGLYMDSAYMSKVLNGKRHSKKIINAICEVLNIDQCSEQE